MRDLAIALGVLTLVVSGCLAPRGGTTTQPTGDAQFYVSDQSFEHPLAHIKVWVDGEPVFDREAPVGNEHNWIPFKLDLGNGTHHVKAHESDTGTDLEQDFQKLGPVWVVVDFWTSPNRFTMTASDRQVMFE